GHKCLFLPTPQTQNLKLESSSLATGNCASTPPPGMPVHLPAEILRGRFVHRTCHQGHVGGHVVLEAVAADVLEQILQMRYFGDTSANKGLQRVVGDSAFAH